VPCVDGSGLARGIVTSQAWSVQPCVRPVCAVHMSAGHNALRGSGPGQKPAFENSVAHMGCPDRRIDRPCITCCSRSQPSYPAACSCPPLECWFETSPIQAEKYWLRNTSPSTTRQYRFEENRLTSSTTVRRAGLIGTRECRASVGTAAIRP